LIAGAIIINQIAKSIDLTK
jgi:hypothetical protein